MTQTIDIRCYGNVSGISEEHYEIGGKSFDTSNMFWKYWDGEYGGNGTEPRFLFYHMDMEGRNHMVREREKRKAHSK